MRQMCEIVETRSIFETRIAFDNECQEPLNGFAPNSHGRRSWSFARMSLNVKVKGQGHQGQKRAVHSHHPRVVDGMERPRCR